MQGKINILIFLAVWKRPHITELCFMGIDRLRKYAPDRFNITALAVISEPSMKAVCKKYNINFVEAENTPLGRKKNIGLAHAFTLPWDYLLEIGSDDLLQNKLLDLYEPHMRARKPYLCMSTMAMADSETGEATQRKSDMVMGLGRCMERQMLESITGRVEVEALESLFTTGTVIPKGKRGYISPVTARELAKANFVKITSEFTYKLWSEHINQGLDNDSTYMIESFGIKPIHIETTEPLGLDIKSRDNIWPYNSAFGSSDFDVHSFLSACSEQERKTFIAILKKSNAARIETA